MTLDAYFTEYLPAVEAEMLAIITDGLRGEHRYTAMIHHHMGWQPDGSPIPGAAGKRIRPVLVLLAAEAAGGNWRAALPFAAAVELIHNFSLLHDDIQDRSPTRRGRPTVWTQWGEAHAINAGDALFAYAFRALHRATLPAERILAAHDLLSATCIHLTQGQDADMDFEQRDTVTVDEYLAMIEGKTAALLAACAELGALAAGADVATRRAFFDYGRHVGLAFQLRDDILGIWGDSAATGKSAATDIETRKKTLPVLYALDRSPELRQMYITPLTAESVPSAIALIEATGARQHTEQAEQHHAAQALAYLAQATPQPNAASQAIRTLTLSLLGRAS